MAKLDDSLSAINKLVEKLNEREGYNDGWNDALDSLKKVDISSCLK